NAKRIEDVISRRAIDIVGTSRQHKRFAILASIFVNLTFGNVNSSIVSGYVGDHSLQFAQVVAVLLVVNSVVLSHFYFVFQLRFGSIVVRVGSGADGLYGFHDYLHRGFGASYLGDNPVFGPGYGSGGGAWRQQGGSQVVCKFFS